MTAQMVGNVLLAFAGTVWMAALAFALLGAAGGVFWPGFNAMIGAVVPSAIRQRYYGVNFTLVNLGIGLGGLLAGLVVDVHRPGTFLAVYLGNAASFLAPLAVLLGPLRHVTGKVEAPPGEDDGPAGAGAVLPHAAARRRAAPGAAADLPVGVRRLRPDGGGLHRLRPARRPGVPRHDRPGLRGQHRGHRRCCSCSSCSGSRAAGAPG